jgi:predicted ABC-type ATPase
MFEKLYDAIKETEEREGTPLVLRGIFFNSADGQNGEKGIDAEAIQGGAEIITNEEELHDFLQAVGVTEAEIENDLTSGVTMQEDIKKAMALRDVNQTREVPGDYDQAEREEDLLEHEQIMADSRAESDEHKQKLEELAEQEHIAEMDEETYEMMIPVPVYKNKTGLYTAEEIEKNNDYVSLYFPESIIEAYCKDQGLDYPDEFFGQYMVHRTRDLADFARERGFEVSKTLPAEYILHRLDSTDTSLTDYIENHYDEAISVMQGGGSILDLEGVLTMEEKLGRSVSYDQYSNLRFEGARITDRMHDRSANNPFNEKFNESTKKALASIFINEGISSDFMDELEDTGILTEYERKLFSDYLSVFPEKKQDILDAVGLTEDYIQNQESLAEAEDIIKEFRNREYGDQADLSDVSKVEIAEGKGIHIYADLENATISTYADDEKLEEMKFGKLKNMLESDDNKSLKKLSSLSSEELINIHLTDTVIERLEEKKMEKLADRVNDLAHDMYSQNGENIPLFPLDKKEMVSALKSGKVEDITTSLVAMNGFVDNNARLEVFNEVRNYSEKEINLLTGLEVSEELNNVMARLAEGEHVSLEEIMTTPEMQQAESRRKAAPEKVTHSDEEIYKAVEKLSAYGSATIDKDGKVSYTGIVDKESRLDIVIGLPASGKSSAIVDDISKEFHSKVLDNDEAKKMFKEFNNGWGASAVHEDSRFVEQVAFERALKNHENIVLPKVGSNADDLVDAYINLAKKEGYKVNIHYVDLEREKALGRMIHRFINQGRYLEPRLIDKYNNEKVGNLVEQAYTKFKTDPEYSKKIDGISRWNNDVNKGEKPILVEAENLSGHYIENARTEEKGGTEHGKAEHGNRGNEQDGRLGSGGQGGSGSR